MATLSFHETKNVTCGEGGALVLRDGSPVERAEILREKGTDRSRFFRGQVDKYTWVDLGSSYLPSEILAAVLLGQLQASDDSQRRRRAVWDRYASELRDWAQACGVRLPIVPPECDHPAHLFYLLAPSAADRTSLIEHLGRAGILATFHYLPLHLSPMGRRLGYAAGQLPVSVDVSARLVRLPLFASLTDEETTDVIAAVKAWAPGGAN